MSNGFLSQEEIDSLLRGTPAPVQSFDEDKSDLLSDIEKDLLGEVGNISMGSASTALSQIINQQVNITTPVVSITTLNEIKKEFHIPNIVLEVEYVSGIIGRNILIIKITDAAVIANLMMGGDGSVTNPELTEIELSAVQEAMNQMIGSAATSMATMFSREVNISPPVSKTWKDDTEQISEEIAEDDKIVKVSFRLTIGNLIDSNIMQILPVSTAKKIVAIMMGQEEVKAESPSPAPAPTSIPSPKREEPRIETSNSFMVDQDRRIQEKPIHQEIRPQVEVHNATFDALAPGPIGAAHKNIDLILDVPLEISVVLGRTKKSIKDILALSNGSLIELDKLADEPVEILVNGKGVAYGEVVVVDENFGVRITSIMSSADRIKSLK